MSKFINPFSDYGFKLIFGSEVSKDLIISFLNGVLHDEVIVNITFRNVEMLGMKQDQLSEEERKNHYWDYNINKVYIVCILNYVMAPEYPDKYRWDVVRMDRELKIPFSETLNEVYLEMPKFVLPLSECKTIYLKWLYVLNNIDIMERLPEELNNQLFQKLKSIVEIERMSANERLEYELSLAVERDLLSALDAKYEDGREEGREEGLKEVARNLKSLGMSLKDIAKATGLTSEEIKQL